jgi:hypothetical protein
MRRSLPLRELLLLRCERIGAVAENKPCASKMLADALEFSLSLERDGELKWENVVSRMMEVFKKQVCLTAY